MTKHQSLIAIVDDEPDLVALLEYNLVREGYSTVTAFDGTEALRVIQKNPPELVILDLMMPGLSGIEVLKALKAGPGTDSIPVIMLTARSEEVDRVLGLELGADDYVTKPFGVRELVARVRAVLRRAGPAGLRLSAQKDATEMAGPQEEESLDMGGGLIIHTQSCQVTRQGKPLELSATEYKLLLYFASRPGKVLSRSLLLSALWKDDVFVESRTVDVHIRRLRAKIEDNPSRPRYIKTRRGLGYIYDTGG